MDRLSYAKRHSQIIVLTTEHCCEENAVNGCPCLDKKGPEARTMVMERERQKSNKFDKKQKQITATTLHIRHTFRYISKPSLPTTT